MPHPRDGQHWEMPQGCPGGGGGMGWALLELTDALPSDCYLKCPLQGHPEKVEKSQVLELISHPFLCTRIIQYKY